MIAAEGTAKAPWNRSGQRRVRGGLVLALAGAALITGYFMAVRIHFLTDFSEASYSPYFWAKRYGLVVHIWAGLIAIICGFAQVWLGITRQTGVLHRRLGWVYVATVGVSAATAIQMATVVPGHFAYASGLFMNAVVWAAATAMGLWAWRCGRTALHREWMMRSYVLALAFTAARIMLPVLRLFVEVPKDSLADDIQATVAWACWVIPLILFDIGRGVNALRR